MVAHFRSAKRFVTHLALDEGLNDRLAFKDPLEVDQNVSHFRQPRFLVSSRTRDCACTPYSSANALRRQCSLHRAFAWPFCLRSQNIEKLKVDK